MISNNTMLFLLVILLLVPTTGALARDKTDLIHFPNGDRITGEIKKLDRGILQVGTDAMGTVNIEWKDVYSIESNYVFQFERTDGTRVTGTIISGPEERSITLRSGLGKVTFAHERVVRISQIEETFIERWNGSFSFGYSFTKASDVAKSNFGFRATHRSVERAYSIDGSTIVTNDAANEDTSRSDLTLGMTQFRANRWFNAYLLGFESNDELGLKLRSSLGAGIGRFLVQTNTSEFSLLGGLAATSERLDRNDAVPGGEAGRTKQESLEVLLGLAFERYIFDSPKMDLSTRFFAFPSLTDDGRLRSQLDVGLRWELIKDLFWNLSYYHTYDSDPPSGGETTSDYGIVTSVGWSF